jgi:sucrose-phosphate synthase
VDPHNQKDIADALLKLVSDRNMWVECRRNGLKNIHCYSWPEHCRTYLNKIAQCRIRHPQWQNENSIDENSDEVESQGDSLRDLKDLSLRLSLDGDRMNSFDLEKILSKYGNGKDAEQQPQGRLVSKKSLGPDAIKRTTSAVPGMHTSKVSILRRRKRLVIIAIDWYDSSGKPAEGYIKAIQEIFKAAQADPAGRLTGFILSTSLSAKEAVSLLNGGGISVNEFDAIIAGSGSELHYPVGNDEAGIEGALHADPDYDTHIDYRWGKDGLRKTLQKVTAPDDLDVEKRQRTLIEDEASFNPHCFAYKVAEKSLVSYPRSYPP